MFVSDEIIGDELLAMTSTTTCSGACIQALLEQSYNILITMYSQCSTNI